MVQKLKDEIRILSAQLANVEFKYRDPAKNFDRSKVKGVVAKLIKVKDSSTMTALEVGYALLNSHKATHINCCLRFHVIEFYHIWALTLSLCLGCCWGKVV